jgi:hypothetical protein
MQPNDDFRQDDFRQEDAQLRELLQEWPAPATPRSLEKHVLSMRKPWWRFLINGYIRVPVPVACCVAVVVMFAAWRSVRPPAAGAPCSIAAQPSVCTSSIPGAC